MKKDQEALHPDTPPERLQALSVESLALARCVAQNPCAPPELLERLSKEQDRDLRAHVVRNPNSPLSVLFSLAVFLPKEFLQNPVLPLLFIERPGFVKEMPTNSLIAVLRCGALAENFLADAYNHSSALVHLALAENPMTPALLLEGLAQSKSLQVKKAVLCHPNRPRTAVALLATDSNHSIQRQAQKAKLHPEERALLVKAGLLGEKKKPSPMTQEELMRLSQLGPMAKAFVAKQENCPLALLRELSQDKEPLVCQHIAENPSTPEDVILSLSTHTHTEVLSRVAQHPTLPPEVVARLTKSAAALVRSAAAKHPNAPPKELGELLFDMDEGVRRSAASHPNVPQEPLQLLYRLGASLTLALPGTPDPTLLPEELSGLSTHQSPFVRMLVARHPNTPLSVLDQLTLDRHISVRVGVMENPVVLSHLERFFGKESPFVLEATRNKSPWPILEYLCAHPSPGVRLRLATNTDPPAALLEVLAEDPVERVREAATLRLLQIEQRMTAGSRPATPPAPRRGKGW